MSLTGHQLSFADGDWATASDGLESFAAPKRIGAIDPSQSLRYAESGRLACIQERKSSGDPSVGTPRRASRRRVGAPKRKLRSEHAAQFTVCLDHPQRQACELIEVPRSMLKYRPVRAERDAPALAAMRRIAATYRRYGYRRVRIFLRREGHSMSPARAYRLCRSAGLQLPRQRPRRRVGASRPRPLPAMGPTTKYGPTTLCTTPAPTGRSSNV